MAFSTLFSRFLFLSAFLLSLSPSASSFSLLLLPLFFSERRTRARGGSSALRPSPCCPRHGVRLPREPQRRCGRRVRHAHCLRVHASCRLGGFAKEAWKRRDCVFASALALTLTLTLTLTHSLCNLSDCPSARAHANFLPSHLSHALSNSSPSSSSSSSSSLSAPLCLILFLCVLFFLFFFTPASSSWCFSCYFFFSFVSALANPCCLKPRWLPAQLLEGVDIGSRTKDLSSNVAWCCVVLRRWE